MIPDDMPWEPWPCQQCHHPVHDPEPCTVESGPARIICNCGPATRQQPGVPGDLRTAHAAYHDAGYGWGHPNGPQPPDAEPCWCPIGYDHDAAQVPAVTTQAFPWAAVREVSTSGNVVHVHLDTTTRQCRTASPATSRRLALAIMQRAAAAQGGIAILRPQP
jgi:hypothetical protein